MYCMDIGKKIKEIRISLGLTQQQLADKIGISMDYLGNIERGERTPGIKSFVRIADSLDISLDYLLRDKENFGEDEVNKEIQSVLTQCSLIEKIKVLKILKAIFPHF